MFKQNGLVGEISGNVSSSTSFTVKALTDIEFTNAAGVSSEILKPDNTYVTSLTGVIGSTSAGNPVFNYAYPWIEMKDGSYNNARFIQYDNSGATLIDISNGNINMPVIHSSIFMASGNIIDVSYIEFSHSGVGISGASIGLGNSLDISAGLSHSVHFVNAQSVFTDASFGVRMDPHGKPYSAAIRGNMGIYDSDASNVKYFDVSGDYLQLNNLKQNPSDPSYVFYLSAKAGDLSLNYLDNTTKASSKRLIANGNSFSYYTDATPSFPNLHVEKNLTVIRSASGQKLFSVEQASNIDDATLSFYNKSQGELLIVDQGKLRYITKAAQNTHGSTKGILEIVDNSFIKRDSNGTNIFSVENNVPDISATLMFNDPSSNQLLMANNKGELIFQDFSGNTAGTKRINVDISGVSLNGRVNVPDRSLDASFALTAAAGVDNQAVALRANTNNQFELRAYKMDNSSSFSLVNDIDISNIDVSMNYAARSHKFYASTDYFDANYSDPSYVIDASYSMIIDPSFIHSRKNVGIGGDFVPNGSYTSAINLMTSGTISNDTLFMDNSGGLGWEEWFFKTHPLPDPSYNLDIRNYSNKSAPTNIALGVNNGANTRDSTFPSLTDIGKCNGIDWKPLGFDSR